MCRPATATSAPCTGGIAAGRPMARGRRSWPGCRPRVTPTPARSGRSRSTRPWSGRIATRPGRATRPRRTSRPSSWRRCCRRRSPRPGRPPRQGTGPESSSDRCGAADRPADREALGRSRGGLTTKIHLLADAACRPLVHATTAGQRHDSLAFAPLLQRLKLRRRGPGRPRTRPDRLLADKAYSNRTIRAELRRRRIIATIPEKADQQKTRAGKGARGGRPPAFDPESYKERNTVERAIGKLKEFRAVAMRTDKREFVFRGTIDVASIKIWLRHPVNQDLRDRPSYRSCRTTGSRR